MAITFTLGELREELGALGYGGVPDDIIFSSLSQLQLKNPWLSDESKFAKSSSFNSGVRGSRATRQVHGSPVVGDRDFAKPKKYSRSRSALDAVCFTSDFASELDEMRKMLQIMEGTKDKLLAKDKSFGSEKLFTRKSSGKRMGLAAEHEQYVGNLMSQWRLVGKTLRAKRNDNDAMADHLERSQERSRGSSEGSEFEQQHAGCSESAQVHIHAVEAAEQAHIHAAETTEQDHIHHAAETREQDNIHHAPEIREQTHIHTAETTEKKDLLDSQNATKIQLEQVVTSQPPLHELHLPQPLQQENTSESDHDAPETLQIHNALENELQHSKQKDASIAQLELQDDVAPANAESTSGTEAAGPDDSDECHLLVVNKILSDCDDVPLVDEFESEEVKGQPEDRLMGDVNGLTCESVAEEAGGANGHVQVEEDKEMGGPFRRQESFSAISPGDSYQQGCMLYPENFIDLKYDDLLSTTEAVPCLEKQPECLTRAELETTTTFCSDQFLAAFEKSLEELDSQEKIGQETFDNVTHKAAEPSSPPRSGSFSEPGSRPSESENPPPSAIPVLRTPNRRVGRQHSPLNDRSNIHTVEDSPKALNARAKAVFRIAEFNSAVSLKRSRSSREPRRIEKAADANGAQHLSDITEDRVDGRPSTIKTPSPTARKGRSERVLNYSLSDKFSSRVTVRNKGGDSSHLDIAALGLSPIRVREPASPLKPPSTSERLCGGASGSAEHRHGTCTVCPAPSVRKSGDSSSSNGIPPGSKSPFGKSVEGSTASSESEASPKKPQPTMRKRSGPSGIYTPLIDQKKPDVVSKVLLKSNTRPSSMDFASESSRPAYRRGLSLRSSTESAKSSGGPQRSSTMSQDSKSTSITSPFSRNSPSTNSFSSHGTLRDKGTPARPMWAGKVDRVARVLEDMRPQSEAPQPFVVPTLPHERVKSQRTFV